MKIQTLSIVMIMNIYNVLTNGNVFIFVITKKRIFYLLWIFFLIKEMNPYGTIKILLNQKRLNYVLHQIKTKSKMESNEKQFS